MHRELQAVRLAIEELIQKWLAENPNERLPGAGQPLDLDEYFRWPEDLRLAYSRSQELRTCARGSRTFARDR